MAPSSELFWTADDYQAKYNLAELQKLVVDQLNINIVDGMDEDFCINALLEANKKDGKWTGPFRFLDLPPEMRNHVYRELLSIPTAGAGGDVMEPAARVNRVLEHMLNEYAWRSPLAETAKRPRLLDQHMLRFEEVNVHLQLSIERLYSGNVPIVEELCIASGRRLWQLVSDLVESGRLKRFVVSVELFGFKDQQFPSPTNNMLQQAFWPLSLLGPSRSVRMTGVPSVVLDHIKTLQATKVPACGVDLVNSAVYLEQGLARCLERMEVTQHRKTADSVELANRVRELLWIDSAFVTAVLIEKVIRAITDMETLLESPEIVEHDSNWEEWISRRHTRSERKQLIEGHLLA
ncbi:hypothetical protein Slin15195_G095800 [Septoria linicola]|uniref:Uncharacterized protein n=1 Tax=Septoria linicola TaxID=215465 RepID=A0A9Q9B4M6_9PEZI|nr:hypothetical protein Slin14017_G058890 [Septoria linicola]USW56261.1 hypothetical protein Slin15195_G095800 [Septoria linicola]